MDVNSVLQNTRQYFQGIPSSSPASGELAPGASVGYSSPPVSSTATSIAAPPSSGAAAGYGAAIVPYNGGRFGPVSSGPPPQSTWSTQPQNSPHNAYQHLAPATNGPRFTQTVVSAPYHHFYERSQKALPSTSNPSYVSPQHAYASPSITRLKEQGVNNQGMFNMDSIVCQPNANYAYGTKIKPKSTMAPSSANVYKQPTQLDDQRYFNHHPSPPTPHPMHSPSTATRVPAVMHHHAALPSHQRPPEMPLNHQSFSHQSVIEQRVGYQQQVSYHASSVVRTSASAPEKLPTGGSGPINQHRGAITNNGTSNAGEPVDVRYYVNRRVETTALQASPAIAKRDSPLDLSVKTIRQSADSTAHDDAESMAALYNHHLHPHHHPHHHHMQQTTAPASYALAQQRDHGPPSMRPATLPVGHLAQLPYAASASSATAAVSLPNIRSHSNSPASAAAAAAAAAAAFNVTHQRTTHYPTPPQPQIPPNASPAVYTPELATPYWNGHGQLQEHHDKAVAIGYPSLSEYRREKTTFSVTIEKEEQIHRTQVNAELRFSSSHQFYQHQNDIAAGKLKATSSASQPPYPEFASLAHAQTKPSLPAAPSPTPNSSRKRKATESPSAPAAASATPIKNPRVSLGWRDNINKEIENRLNAYTSMKAREQQEREASKIGPGASPSPCPSESYRDIVPSPSPLSSHQSRLPQATPSPQPPAIDGVLRTNVEKDRERKSPATSFPTAQYLEQKAQHKLPVQPIHPYPQWYSGQQRAPANSAMQTFKSPRSDSNPAYPNHHAVKFSKSSFETRDLKMIEKVELKQEQTPLPPFQAFASIQNSTSHATTQFNNERIHKPSAESAVVDNDKFDGLEKVVADKKSANEDGQSRAALMASAAAHPRFRTKAELKQVTPVDKSKDKTNAETNTAVKLPEAQSNKKSRSHFDSGPKLFAGSKGFSNSDSHHVNHTRNPSSNFDPDGDLLSPESPSNLVIDLGRQFSPRKRSSDSEDESNVADVHSLNDMRKDRKTRTPPSGTVTPPTVIDQLNDEYTDDSKWLEACDELIQQFANPGQKKRGRKKKPASKFIATEVDPPAPSLLPPPPPAPPAVPPALSVSKMDTDSSSDSDDDKPLIASKIKKEVLYESDDDIPHIKPTAVPAVLVKKEQIDEDRDAEDEEDKQESEGYEEDEEEDEESEQASDSDSSYEATKSVKDTRRRGKLNGTIELRGQRSNVSTTRIRIQNSLEDSSAAESSDTDDSYKAPVKKMPLRKAKVVKKKKKLPKSKMITRKKGKIIDPKREKVRHMMLRRIVTRKSRMDALKTSKSAQKTRNDSTTSEEQQPIMTRKMTRQECQREKSRMEELRSKKPLVKKPADEKAKSKDKSSSDDKSKAKSDRSKDDKSTKAKDDKCKKDKPEDKSKSKSDEKSKSKKDDNKVKSKDKSPDESSNQKTTPTKSNEDKTPVKSSGKDTPVKQSTKANDSKTSPASAKKDIEKGAKPNDKSKKPVIKAEPKEQPVEDVTRRSLRSRNIVVDEKNSPAKKASPKKPDLAKTKSPIKSKNEERKKPPPAPPPPEIKPEKPPSWEEELFNYKYSLRMPVKLINIAKPPNWPKNIGGASSLPDLDRSESDSDLLSECPKQSKTTPKKRDKDESKVSNTKEFKDSVKFLKEKFDKKIEEHKATSLTQLMIDNKMKIIPKSSDGPELLPTPSLDSLKTKLNNKSDSPKKNNSRKSKDTAKTDDDEKEDIIEDSLIGYFRKETVDEFKEVFEKHQVANQFKTVILESRTRTQTKEMKHNATLKQVFGCDRPASAPPVSDLAIDDDDVVLRDKKVKNSTNGCLKGWHKSFAKFKLLMEEEKRRGDEKNGCNDFEDTVDFVYREAPSITVDAAVAVDCKDNNEPEIENVVKRKSRSFRRKCRSSGFDYIRKKKKQKKEDDDEIDDKERKKPVAPMRPTPESIEDIQNEIKSWVVNKGIGETVLHKAARLGYSDISSYCLEKMSCTPSPTDNAGYTPLHEACTRGHLKIAKMLLKYGADVSASAKGGIRPLHEAAEHGNVELVRLLLAYGADPLLSTYAGQTPLSLVKDEQDDLKEFLMLYLADIQGIQGSPSKPWPFLGYNNIDEENCGYDPITDCPPPSSPEHVTSVDFEISDIPLPTLYRFKNDTELWILCSDLPAKIRDSITKKNQHQQPLQQDTNAVSAVAPAISHYVTKKITRAEFEETVECASFLDYKFSPKISKSKTNYTMVKYNDKLLAALNIQKLTMSFS